MPQGIRLGARSTTLRGRAEGHSSPKKEGEEGTIGSALRADAPGRGQPIAELAARIITRVAGNVAPTRLSPALVAAIDDSIRAAGWALTTETNVAAATRRLLRHIWEYHGAPKLDYLIAARPAIRPRNRLATQAQVAAMVNGATPALKLWLLLCSELAMRSGTAIRLGPREYNAERREFRFVTKKNAHLTLPATAAIQEMIALCDLQSAESFVLQLHRRHGQKRAHTPELSGLNKTMHKQLRKLERRLGFKTRIVAHDLRRTTAVLMLEHTNDVRDVQALLGHRNLQSTLWYLDHDQRPVSREALELISHPTWRKERTA
jgi:integrase